MSLAIPREHQAILQWWGWKYIRKKQNQQNPYNGQKTSAWHRYLPLNFSDVSSSTVHWNPVYVVVLKAYIFFFASSMLTHKQRFHVYEITVMEKMPPTTATITVLISIIEECLFYHCPFRICILILWPGRSLNRRKIITLFWDR